MSNFVILSLFLFMAGLLLHLIAFAKDFSNAGATNNNHMMLVMKLFLGGCTTLFFSFLFFMFLFDITFEIDAALFLDFFNKKSTSTYQLYNDANTLKFEMLLTQSLLTMLLIIICSIYYCVQFTQDELTGFILYINVIFCGGAMLLVCTTPICIFFSYELILVPTAIVLTVYSKTGRSREATSFMILWTQIGAVMLLFVTIFLSSIASFGNIFNAATAITRSQLNLVMFLIFFAFATKMPIWPFYWWLPEAHVEVSTNFSIVLSGVTIKFAFLGFIRFVDSFGGSDIWWLLTVITIIGLLDSAIKIDTECDIKKIVAYQTVSEMHLLCIYTMLDYDSFIDLILYLLPGHCWISTLSFLLVDMITKRYHSRNIEHLYGIMAESPRLVKFIIISVFILGSLPGTLIFSIEFYINILGSTTMFNFILFIIFQCLIVVFSRNVWWLLFGGDIIKHTAMQSFTLTRQELFFILFLMLQLIPSLFFMDIFFI